jgi:hypothetical protein
MDQINYQVGDLIFAPFREIKWPGYIIYINVMVDIKLFKIKDPIKTSLNQLISFDCK